MSVLISEIQRRYHFTVYGYEATALGYAMETNKGKVFLYSLPQVFLAKERFIRDVYAGMAGNRMLLPIIPTVDGEEILELGENFYYMTGWPYEESNIVDYALLGDSLASFHLASSKRAGFQKGKFNHWGIWPRTWNLRVGRLEGYRKNAIRRMEREAANEFDVFFADNFKRICFLGARAISYLGENNYPHVVKKSRDFGTLGYNHFSFDQFIMTPQRHLFFVDAFSWVEDMRARDLGHFIKEDVREYGWNPYHIHALLTAYHAKSPLLPEEFAMMYACFILPDRVLKKLECINHRPKMWVVAGNDIAIFRDEVDELTAVVAYEELQRNDVLLREFPRYAASTFGVAIRSAYEQKKSP